MENLKHPTSEKKTQHDEPQDERLNPSRKSSFEPDNHHSDSDKVNIEVEKPVQVMNEDEIVEEMPLEKTDEETPKALEAEAEIEPKVEAEAEAETEIEAEAKAEVEVETEAEAMETVDTEKPKETLESEVGKEPTIEPVYQSMEGSEKELEHMEQKEEKEEDVVIKKENIAEKPEAEEEMQAVKQVEGDSEKEAEVKKDSIDSKTEQEDSKDRKEDSDENDDNEGDEEGEEELFEKYNKLGREELVEVLEVLVKEDDVNHIRSHIGYVKAAFRKLLKDESLADYENRMQREGDQEEETEAVVDVLSERYDQALLVYKDKKAVYDQALERQKQGNLTVKEKILEELRNLIESEEELKKTYDYFRELQDQWRQIGAVPQGSKNTLWNNYHFLVEKFFDKVKINKELKDLDLKKNLEAKTELSEKAEELLLESSITKSFQQLQKLHEAWKETGPVPKDKKDEIWERFKAATEKLNKRRQDYYDTLRDEQNKNYAAKLILCEEAEQLTAVSPESPKQWQQYTNKVNELFKMWKTIGFAPKKVNNEVWNRFRSSLDTFYRNKKEFFGKYKEHQTENYNQKLNLCLQAEALKDNEDWRTTTEELIGLQKEWKKIGPVPAKFSDKIWKRFRAACDEFFNNKSEHFANIGEKQDENLKKKLTLIDHINDHKYTDDNTHNLKVLKDYQREWMEIGHVPIKQKDKVQIAFRKAIDEQFDRLNISKKVKSTLNYRSKLDNLKNAPNADNLIYKERNFIINKIATIQSDIKIWENNIGFFASSKKADILKAEFEEKIDRGRQEILILEEKLKILRES